MKTKELETLIIIRGTFNGFPTYNEVLEKLSSQTTDAEFEEGRSLTDTHDVCNLQYTSGSTGDPKAAMLTNQYVTVVLVA